MKDLLILPNLVKAANKPPPKEFVRVAGFKPESPDTFQRMFEQTKKKIYKLGLTNEPEPNEESVSDSAQKGEAESAANQITTTSPQPQATIPTDPQNINSIQPNPIGEKKEEVKPEQIENENSATNQPMNAAEQQLATLPVGKITKTDSYGFLSLADNSTGKTKDNGNSIQEAEVTTDNEINLSNETAPVGKSVQGLDRAQKAPLPIELGDSTFLLAEQDPKSAIKAEAANIQNPSSANLIDQKTVQPNGQGEVQSQVINLNEVPADPKSQVRQPEIAAQPERKEGPPPTTAQGDDLASHPINLQDKGNQIASSQKLSDLSGETLPVKEDNASITHLKSGMSNSSVWNTVEKSNKPVFQNNLSAPTIEESIVGKTYPKPKDDPPFENIQSGMPQPLMPQNKLNEPARLAEAPRTELLQQLATDLAGISKTGQQSWRVQLHPESLGKIDLQMTADGQGVRIVMNADQAATGFMLERHLGELKEMLQHAGVNLAGLSVNSGNAQSHSNEHLPNTPLHLRNRHLKINSMSAEFNNREISKPMSIDDYSRLDYRI